MFDFIAGLLGTGGPTALQQLRLTPEQALYGKAFCVVDEAYPNQATGGPCRLACTGLGDDVFRLAVQPGLGDYYFPWIPRGAGGVGDCMVPLGCPDGTIVLTGGMNGCAFQVNRTPQGLHFNHDADSCSLRQDQLEGNQVCRVGYDDYATRLELGQQALFQTQPPAGGGAFHYAYYLMAIKRGGRWGVYASGVVQSGNRYTRIRVPFPLMASFDEDE